MSLNQATVGWDSISYRKRFCPQGHDKDEVGRKDGRCRECDILRDREYRKKYKERISIVKNMSNQRYKNTIAGNRAQMRSAGQRLKVSHLAAEQSLELIFAEVNEVLAG